MLIRIALVSMVAGSVLAAPFAARAADPVQLKFAFPAPVFSFVNKKGMSPWIKEVEEAAGGTLKIKLFAGPTLGNFRNIYDRTLKGVADISFGIFGPLAGQFPRTIVASLPFESRTASEAGLALLRIYDKGVIAKEYGRVKVISLFNFPSAHVHTKKPIRTLDDIKGMKFSVSSRLLGQIVAKLGGAPVPMPPPEIYQSMNRGVIDGIVTSWTAVHTFKLDEVSNYHVEAPLGMSPAFVFMNKRSYARLPAKAKQAIDRYHGEPLTKRLGREIDKVTTGASKRIGAKPGHSVVPVAKDQEPLWRARIKSVVDGWAERTPDGKVVLAAFRKEIEAIRSGM